MPSFREMIRHRMRRTGEDEATATEAVSRRLGAYRANGSAAHPGALDTAHPAEGEASARYRSNSGSVSDAKIHHHARKRTSAGHRSATLPSWAIPAISMAGGLGCLVLFIMLLIWILRASLT
jgi:hypothetical protein